jgi:signal transduction histidine kinase
VEKLFKISCTVESAEGLVIVDRDVVNQLFRLAQEAVNNSVKHGKARRVQISLQILGDKTVLTIRDDGVGFRREATASKGLGLRIMGYRAQRIGARFDIQRGERGGTIVTCAVPETLKKDAA